MPADSKFPINPPGVGVNLKTGDEPLDESAFPHAFRLNRLREIPLTGEDFIQNPGAAGAAPAVFPPGGAWLTEFNLAVGPETSDARAVSARSALQALFEADYNVPPSAVLRPEEMQRVPFLDLTKNGIQLVSGAPGGATFYVNLPALGFTADKPISKGVVLRRKKTARVYLCFDADGRPISPEGYATISTSPEVYLSFWRSVHSLVMVADSAAGAKVLSTEASYISNEAAAIFDEVSTILPKYEVTYRLIRGFRDQLKVADSVRISDSEATRLVMANFASVYGEYIRMRGRLGELRERAARFNWILLVDDLSEKLPDDKDRLISVGLYTNAMTTYRWKIEVTINQSESSKSSSSSFYERSFRETSAQVIAYQAAGRPSEPYGAAIEALIRNTHLIETGTAVTDAAWEAYRKQFAVVIAVAGDDGYFSQDGRRLEEILAFAEQSDEFRKRLIVVLPEYDYVQGVHGGERVKGYWVFLRPLPAMVPTRFPRLFIRESLSYALQWHSLEYGAVVKSVCLAPGEQQTLASSSSLQISRTHSVAESSSAESTAAQQTELAESIERELRSEMASSSTQSGGFSLSVPIKAVNLGLDFSGSSSDSLNSFSNDIQKTARKAAAQTTSKYTRTRTESFSETETWQSTASANGTITNPNSGAPMTILYFQLLNRYLGGLRLEKLDALVLLGTELISGSGLFNVKVIPSSNLLALDRWLGQKNLPFPVDEPAWFAHILRQAVDLLKREYISAFEEEPPSEKDLATEKQLRDRRTPLVRLSLETSSSKRILSKRLEKLAEKPPTLESLVFSTETPTPDMASAAGRRAMCQAGFDLLCLQELLEDAIYTGRLVGMQKLLVPSGAYHAEAYLGDRVSMEEFALRMREAEVSRAENEAQAVLLRAAAEAECAGSYNTIRKVLSNAARREIQIIIQRPISRGKWKVRFRNEDLAVWDAEVNPGRVLVISDVKSEILKQMSEADRFSWVLVNVENGQCFTSDENTSYAGV